MEIGYVNVASLPDGSNNINPIRLQALEETASTLGARGALAFRSERINTSLEKQTNYLDQVFNFNQLLMKHNVLPPVLTQSNETLALNDSKTLRTADQTYEILSPARFVTAPPNWREYLWMSYPKPDLPDKSLLPTSKEEALVWNTYLDKGWLQGLQQANDIFDSNLNRLKRDYTGMVLYRTLLAQNMISSPAVSKAELGVTGDANSLRINDQIMRITAESTLNPDSKQWQPVLTKGP